MIISDAADGKAPRPREFIAVMVVYTGLAGIGEASPNIAKNMAWLVLAGVTLSRGAKAFGLFGDNAKIPDKVVQTLPILGRTVTDTAAPVADAVVPGTGGPLAVAGRAIGAVFGGGNGGTAQVFGKVKPNSQGSPHRGSHTRGNWQSDLARDYAVPAGTPVYALFDGTIGQGFGTFVSSDPRLAGSRLTVEGKSDAAYYAHLSKYASGIAPGVKVKKGQLLGYSGRANGLDHLHLAVRSGDPKTYLGV